MDYRSQILQIRSEMLRGRMTIEEAKKAAQPLIDEMNIKGEKIAKEHGRKFRKFTFGYLMR
jgi:hypothetical protein